MPFTPLPNTSLSATVVSKAEIYTYAQAYNSEIIEIAGKLTGSPETYALSDDDELGIGLTKQTSSAPAKRFTPLASVYSDNHRFVFYVDDDNYLRDVYYNNGRWQAGDLYHRRWKCAPYSKLAAIRLTNPAGYNFVCLYFQDTAATGDIRLVNRNPHGWAEGLPPLNDPPLYGTSLAVVPPEPGIEVQTESGTYDSKDAVLFFQYDRLELGSSQDLGDKDYATYSIGDKTRDLSAHASIAAVDDGTNFWAFYTSDNNQIQQLRVTKDGVTVQPRPVALETTPIPRSSLAAVLVPGSSSSSTDKIVLFYLLHFESVKRTAQEVNIFASTLSAQTQPATDAWGISRRVCLTE
ncbi:hypothetical protein B0T19DRAFT_467100 [Cercophora scortea]|uniref:Fucose-specific lectin n=1 Tax=Cercophora scortea TaxID=314031 RepID=A0AAE0M6C6_9PEZI|nr:hypothetical protein B0T19DRAFT_467100 [Cercophora scortea]